MGRMHQKYGLTGLQSVVGNNHSAAAEMVMAASKLKMMIKSKTVSKPSNTENYISSGINPTQNAVLSAYETANAAGANITLGATASNVYAYLYDSSGNPYKSAATITFYYVSLTD